MTRPVSRRCVRKLEHVHKPTGVLQDRVQAVGPERFGILSIDCAKTRSKIMLGDFYGRVLMPPTFLVHTRGELHAAIDRVRQLIREHALRDQIVAIERTGEYHRPVQRAFRTAGFEVRLVHPLATQRYRQPADPGNKTDDTDLAAIHRAAVNGFGLCELPLPAVYQQLQLLTRHRRDLVYKTSALCCQLREQLHALMPGYADLFENLWHSAVALLLARQTGSVEAVMSAEVTGLAHQVTQAGLRVTQPTLAKIVAWAHTAPPAHPQTATLRSILDNLDDDRLAKTRQIQALERAMAGLLVQTPYLLLLVIPGIHVVSAADLAGEMGPIDHYANANAITGRAGVFPSRYQSDRVDKQRGPLVGAANRRLRFALLQIADNLIACNHHFQAQVTQWKIINPDPRRLRVKVAKTFSRLLFAMIAGRQVLRHPCCQVRHYILDKLLTFHHEHDTPMSQVQADLLAAAAQLPAAEVRGEAQPLVQRLEKIHTGRRRGPQPLADLIPLVLAKLGIDWLQSTVSEDQGPSARRE